MLVVNIVFRKEGLMMKKIIAGVLVLVSVMLVLASCGKFTCDGCGEEKSGKKHEVEAFGVSAVLCDECYEEIADYIE